MVDIKAGEGRKHPPVSTAELEEWRQESWYHRSQRDTERLINTLWAERTREEDIPAVRVPRRVVRFYLTGQELEYVDVSMDVDHEGAYLVLLGSTPSGINVQPQAGRNSVQIRLRGTRGRVRD